jgi:hypothetical protein
MLGSFGKPSRFKAVVTVADKRGDGRITALRQHAYKGTADDFTGWNPASTVKLYAAVSALLRVQSIGLSDDAVVTFRGDASTTTSLREMVDAAVGPSSNVAYNRLVQVSGFDFLNCDFLTERNGIKNSALRRAYAQTEWKALGESASFVNTPALEISDGSRNVVVPAEKGTCDTSFCAGAACTTLQDLTEAMARTMLRMEGAYDLPEPTRLWLGSVLSSKRTRGEEMVTRIQNQLAQFFNPAAITIYHKAGFSLDWYSDVALVDIDGHPHAYLVAMAGYPGRNSLNDAATAVGRAIADGVFDDAQLLA